MDTLYLREFILLAELCNFTKAANRLNISQPALSKHLMGMEKELGIELFSRDSGHVSLTPLGKVFLDHAQQIVLDCDEAYAQIKELKAVKPMTITLETYIPYRPMEDFIHSAKFSLKHKFPLLEVIIRGIENSSPLEDVREGVADMCFISFSDEADLTGLEAVPIYTVPIAAVVKKEHRLAECGSISAKDINDDETVWVSSSPALIDHMALLKKLLTDHGASPTFRKRAWNSAEQLYDYDFNSGIYVGALDGILQETTLTTLNDYSVLRFKDEGMEVETNAIFRKDTSNEACSIVLQTLQDVIEHVDLSVYWATK